LNINRANFRDLQLHFAFFALTFSTTIPFMRARRSLAFRDWLRAAAMCAAVFSCPIEAQQAPPASGARILILPRQVVSGERATLAVLDVNGRLTPGVTVNFSNGDKLTTDATGRALFVAPLNSGIVFASIAGRTGRVPTAVLTAAEAGAASIEVVSVPRAASVNDRFEVAGRGFCGEADANQVTIGGEAALVLASSPASLAILPPADLAPGPRTVEITCAKRAPATFSTTFVALELEANSSPLAPGERRTLTVHVRGTSAKLLLEARNLAPEITEMSGGTVVRLSSSGGADNSGHFGLVGRKRGSFLISIRLVTSHGPPRP
jgi:hypothetical protein